MKNRLFKSIAMFTILTACFCLANVPVQAKELGLAVVADVDTTAKTVTLRTGKGDVQVYHLTAITKITINGESGTLEKIRKGMHADISVGGGVLSKIDLTGTGTDDTVITKRKRKSGN